MEQYVVWVPRRFPYCRYAKRTGPGSAWIDCGRPTEVKVGDDWYCQEHGIALQRAEDLSYRGEV